MSFGPVFLNAATAAGADIETTASVFWSVAYHIGRDRGIPQRLRAGLASATVDLPDLELDVSDEIPCLPSILMDGVHLSTVATCMARVAPYKDLVFNKRNIPAGTPATILNIVNSLQLYCTIQVSELSKT
ncbi:hypothetical protein F5B18DRAFT_594227 [Nemania serpens]|nr:hypothetical protein F5B18DRAFT_594227 [Nemania serpens]